MTSVIADLSSTEWTFSDMNAGTGSGPDGGSGYNDRMSTNSEPVPDIDREALRSLLERWQKKEIDGAEMIREAEKFEDSVFRNELDHAEPPPHDSRSIGLAVLELLSTARISAVLPEDIPILMAFLETPAGKEKVAWQIFDRYWNQVDLDGRKSKVRSYFGESSGA